MPDNTYWMPMQDIVLRHTASLFTLVNQCLGSTIGSQASRARNMAHLSGTSLGLRSLSFASRHSTSMYPSMLAALCPRMAAVRTLSSLAPQRASLQVARFTSSAAQAGPGQAQNDAVYEASYDPAQRNLVILQGILGKDIELKTMPTGRFASQASLAVSVGKDQPTNWYDLKIYGSLAESAATHLRKGSRVVVHGYLRQEQWNDRNSGAKRSKTLVVANSIGLLPRSNPEQMEDSGIQAGYVAQWPQGDEQQATHYAPAQEQEYGMQQDYDEQPQQAMDIGMPAVARDDAEAQWMAVVSNPKEWWDNRKNKRNPKAPDFKHKTNGMALWMNSRGVPEWAPRAVERVYGA